MAIDKLPEFAKDGQKNTDKLVLTDGFPVLKKPARQWFNWLFNTLTKKINEIIDADFMPKSDVIDNLTTDDASKPLSAAQGKILNDQKLNKDENAVGIKSINNRILKPSEISLGVQAYFATLNSDSSAFFCDFLSLNGWNDATGGLKNALVLSKTGQSLHHYQAEYASQTWTIKKQIAYIDDNVASASKLQNPRQIFGQNFDGTNDVNGTVTASTGIFRADEYHFIDTGRNGVDRMNFHGYAGIFNFIDTKDGTIVARISQNGIDCNAASASKLQTPRNIAISGDVSGSAYFDGSGNIQINTSVNGFDNWKGQNGYTKLPNGLILQWGTQDYASNPGEVSASITFPIAFPNSCLNISLTRKINAHSHDGDGTILLISTTQTMAHISLQHMNSSTVGGLRGYTWLAIGY